MTFRSQRSTIQFKHVVIIHIMWLMMCPHSSIPLINSHSRPTKNFFTRISVILKSPIYKHPIWEIPILAPNWGL